MNAKEIAAIYEPLWNAVPGTRPGMLGFMGVDDPKGRPDLNCWWRLGKPWFDDDAAAALCRVAAEDWLIHQFNQRCASINLSKMVGDGDYFVNRHSPGILDFNEDGTVNSAQYHTSHRGPTLHHALVAACLAVHNASPSAAPPS